MLSQARDPIDRVITLLLAHFHATDPTLDGRGDAAHDASLAIAHGQSGARLTHSHERQ